MKKITVIILAAALAFCLAFGAFAEDAAPDAAYDSYEQEDGAAYDDAAYDDETMILFADEGSDDSETMVILSGENDDSAYTYGAAEKASSGKGSKFNPLLGIVISLVVGFGIAFIVTASMKSELKSVRSQDNANVYTTPGSLNLTNRNEFYLYKKTESTPRPKQTPPQKQ